MPVYIVHCFMLQRAPESFPKQLAALHAKTFNTDPEAVRVKYIANIGEDVKAFGGYGIKPSSGLFSVTRPSDYMIAYVDFRGPPEVWQDFCRKVTKLYGSNPYPLQSIYLQRLESEFEFGGLISAPMENPGSSTETAPPGYGQ